MEPRTILAQFSQLCAGPPLSALPLDTLWIAIEDRCVAFLDGCDIEASCELTTTPCFAGKCGIVIK